AEIEQAQEELVAAEELAEKSEEEAALIEQVNVPQPKRITPKDLFEEAKKKPAKRSLEETAEEAPEKARKDEKAVPAQVYQQQGEQALAYQQQKAAIRGAYTLGQQNVYETLKDIRDKVSIGQELSGQEKSLLESYIDRVPEIHEAEKFVTKEEVLQNLSKSEYVLKQIRQYTGEKEHKPKQYF
ncbi:hypothetical protein HY642_06445, partial [Candidatus Woesearchaeota archaeon]|nr:hypothetical protein [Candidatus Woesearchaeota archaeon]